MSMARFRILGGLILSNLAAVCMGAAIIVSALVKGSMSYSFGEVKDLVTRVGWVD